jgi:hypothetical protein
MSNTNLKFNVYEYIFADPGGLAVYGGGLKASVGGGRGFESV